MLQGACLSASTLLILLILFVATFIRSAFGFGEALVAVPLLAFVIPVETAAPLAVLVSITVAAVALLQDWRKVHFASAAWLLLATLLGTPLGLLLLTAAPEQAVKAGLGAVIIAFSLYSLSSRHTLELKNDRLAPLFGFLAGVLGGAYGMNGPPLVLYGSLRRWSPQHFRATLQGYFLPASALAMTGYAVAGLWASAITEYYLLALPPVLIAVLLGRALNQRLNLRIFLRLVHLGLIVIGAMLLLQSSGRLG